MDRTDKLIRIARDDRTGIYRYLALCLPMIPEAREGERLAASEVYVIRLLLVSHPLPLATSPRLE